MKTNSRHHLPTLLAIFLLGVPAVGLRAQESNSTTPPPPPHQGDRGPMANLSEAERAQVKAAHDKAIAADPSLKEKMKAAHEAMESARQSLHAAMIKEDPSVEPILAKMTPAKWGRGGDGPGEMKNKAGRHHAPPGLANLTQEERQKLKALHEKVKSDPAVVAAHEAKKNASTPQERMSAMEALRKASDEAMIKEDPSVEPILEKLHQGGTPPPSPESPAGMSAPQ